VGKNAMEANKVNDTFESKAKGPKLNENRTSLKVVSQVMKKAKLLESKADET